jgi:hypothetical protein
VGSYYDVELAFNFPEDVPADVVSAVSFLVGELQDSPARPDHPYFTDYTWESGALAEYAATTPIRGAAICSFRRVHRFSKAGQEHYENTFHLRCSCKLESVFEDLLLFAQWAATHCDGRQFVGYFVVEFDWYPTLLYFDEGKLYVREAREPPQSVIDGSPWPDRPANRAKATAAGHARKRWWRLWR